MAYPLSFTPEVRRALDEVRPVVALESTIIAHGMPYPQNVETARAVEDIVREGGGVPATIAIIGGVLKVGLTAEELDRFGREGRSIAKVSVRDLPFIVAQKLDGRRRLPPPCASRRWRVSMSLPPAESVACTGVQRRLSISPPT